MNRREFLYRVALTGAAITTVKEAEAMSLLKQSFDRGHDSSGYDLVAVMGGEPEEMLRKALNEMGGMKKFISAGDKVTVKPNIGWDQPVEMGANSNPQLVGEVIRQCFEAGAAEVTVFDHSCDDWRKSYLSSGIEKAAKEAGAKVLPADQESYYKTVSIPEGRNLKSAKIHQAILDSDKWINVPVLKNHGGAQLTISMKNYMGIVWDRSFFHANDLQQCIADICTFEKRPVLNIVDAYRLMKSSGPRGKSLSDVVLSKGLFISQDIIAVDTAAANFFNQVREIPLDKVTHIAKGEKLGVGTMNLDKLNIKRVRL